MAKRRPAPDPAEVLTHREFCLINGFNSWSECQVPINVLLMRERYADGHAEEWALKRRQPQHTAYNFDDGEWHHVATIADGANLRTYYDGVLVGTGGTATASYGSSTFNVRIGGGGVFDASGNFFPGQIDEVAIFDKAVSAERVAAHYRAGKEGGVIVTSGAVGGDTPSGIQISAARSGNNISISWSPAGGTLQSTTELAGAATVWTDVGTANPATIAIAPGNRFYRVRAP